MELLQIFDKEKNMLNEYVERTNKRSLPFGKYYMIILLFIQNSDGKFLIQKVTKDKGDVYATTGGHATFGDDNIKTAIKECKEELGITLNKNELKLINSEIEKCCYVEIFYCQKDFNINDLVLQKEEVVSASWLSVDEIHKLMATNQFRKANIPAFEKIFSYLKLSD